jgi:hypothetical protein
MEALVPQFQAPGLAEKRPDPAFDVDQLCRRVSSMIDEWNPAFQRAQLARAI